jgi:hypothetical protein
VTERAAVIECSGTLAFRRQAAGAAFFRTAERDFGAKCLAAAAVRRQWPVTARMIAGSIASARLTRAALAGVVRGTANDCCGRRAVWSLIAKTAPTRVGRPRGADYFL